MIGYKPNYIFGISGGVDSALNSTLAVIAVGTRRVRFYNMPSKYNSEATKNVAKKLAANLGVHLTVIPIDELVEVNRIALYGSKTLNETSATPNAWPVQLIEENVQAKVRGTTLLSNLAAIENGIVVCNGNKLEFALGYATLYGDINGAFAPIGDLNKAEVFEMCRLVNRICGELIPEDVIPFENTFDFGENKVAPSAELKMGQIDPMKFGYHDRLLELVTISDCDRLDMVQLAEKFERGTLFDELKINKNITDRHCLKNPKIFFDDLEWFFGKMRGSVFKRVQAPPIVVLSSCAFGSEFRESIFPFETCPKYDEIKNRVLNTKNANGLKVENK